MLHEQIFICWHHNQNENEGKEILATSFRLAAKKAVKLWSEDELLNLIEENHFTINVKDEGRRIHHVHISHDELHPFL